MRQELSKCVSERERRNSVCLSGYSRYRIMVSTRKETSRGIHGDMCVNLGGNHESFVPKGWKIFFMAAAPEMVPYTYFSIIPGGFYEEKRATKH